MKTSLATALLTMAISGVPECTFEEHEKISPTTVKEDKCKCEKGEKGDPGTKGEKGELGPKGETAEYKPKCPSFATQMMINGHINQCLYRVPKTDYEKINGKGATGVTWRQCLKTCAEVDMSVATVKSALLACIADPKFYDSDKETHWIGSEIDGRNTLSPEFTLPTGWPKFCVVANDDKFKFASGSYFTGVYGPYVAGTVEVENGCLCYSRPH